MQIPPVADTAINSTMNEDDEAEVIVMVDVPVVGPIPPLPPLVAVFPNPTAPE